MAFWKASTGALDVEPLLLSQKEVVAVPHIPLPGGVDLSLSGRLRAVQSGRHNTYAAQTLATIAGWSYSAFGTFKNKVMDNVGSDIDTLMIEVKNEPMLVQVSGKESLYLCLSPWTFANYILSCSFILICIYSRQLRK
jgi:hypothetical protein